jgi:hypothetical protein
VRLGICVVIACASTAAAGPKNEDKAEADRLFDQARDLMTKGDRVEACKLFDLSLRKDPRAVGTMLNVGLCNEEGGSIATAMRFYAEARDRAGDQGLTEHREAAERKLALLAPRVPHLEIVLPPGAPATTRVLVDDLVLARNQLADLTVDPGTRSIVVAAPDKLPYETKITVVESQHAKVVVPALQGAQTVVVETSNRALIGKLGVAGGAVIAGVGIGFGIYADHLYWSQFPDASRDGADAIDPNKPCYTLSDPMHLGGVTHHCSAAGSAKLRTANRWADAADVVGIAGVVIAATNTYLWWSAPAHVAVDVGADHAAVSAVGRF